MGLLIGCASDGTPGGSLADVAARRGGSHPHHAAKFEGPCRFGGWGEIGRAGALHVRADGSDIDGDGSLRRPFASVGAALERARGEDGWRHAGGGHGHGDDDDDGHGNGHGHHGNGHGNGHDDHGNGHGHGHDDCDDDHDDDDDDGDQSRVRIAVGPGIFPTTIHLVDGDPRVTIVGCSATETRLEAVSQGATIIDADGHVGGELDGVTLYGGRRALRVRDGARFEVHDSVVDSSRQVGVFVHDPDTRLKLVDTDVVDTVSMGDRGWGIAVVDDGTLTMTRGSVLGSTGLGLFGDDATFTLTDIEVMDTGKSGRFGELGRGMHLQNGSRLDMTGGLFRNNADAGIFLHEPGSVKINGLVIDITSAGIVIDFPSTGLSGDGIVIYGGQQQVSLSDNLIAGSARAALLVDGVDALLDGNVTDDNGLVIAGLTKFAQEDAEVAGEDAGEVYQLQGPLLLNTWALDGDPLLDE